MSDETVTPKTAKEFALRAAQHGLEVLEGFSQNPHDFSKVAGHLNETIRILWQIEFEDDRLRREREIENRHRHPRPMLHTEPTPKSDAALRRLDSSTPL